ncbi:MerR family transcriptional regulator [Haloferula chungangensis]|uniref:MerR family transcriptional regulator n=1 Tax=Haloferula chungangensis TaxID=1048331 RepID=A0ABW2LBJ1_9BACT
MNEGLYGMRAVAERTGLKAPSIRMWEKRYGAVVPERTETNRRVYRSEDVERLSLMKKLTDRGHAISRIAHLGLESLQTLLNESLGSEIPGGGDGGGQPRRKVGIVSAGPAEMLDDMDLFEADVVGKAESLEMAAKDPEFPKLDLLIVEAEALFPETISSLRNVVQACDAKLSLVVYRFASSKTVTALAKAIVGVRLVKAPLTDIQLRRECLVLLNSLRGGEANPAVRQAGPIPERLYEADQLARLSRISSTIECECPQHMAELLKALSAFEKYSAECEDRNAEDALMHAFLHRTTAQVRRTMEEALRHLIHSEGLKLD